MQCSHQISINISCQHPRNIHRMYWISRHQKLPGRLRHDLQVRHQNYSRYHIQASTKPAFRKRRRHTLQTNNFVHCCCLYQTVKPILQPNYKTPSVSVILRHPRNQHQVHPYIPNCKCSHLRPQQHITESTQDHCVRSHQATGRMVFMGPHQDRRF